MPKPGTKTKGAQAFQRRRVEFVAFSLAKGQLAQEVPLRGCVGVGVRVEGKLMVLDESENGVALSSEGGRLVLHLRASDRRVVVSVE